MHSSVRSSVAVAQNTPECNHFQVNMLGRFTYVQGEALDATGFSHAEWGSVTVADLCAQAPELEEFYTALLGGQPAHTRCMFNGHLWDLRGLPIFTPDGVQVGGAGVALRLDLDPPAPRDFFVAGSDNRTYGVEEFDVFAVDFVRQRVKLVRDYSFQVWSRYAATDATCHHQRPAVAPVVWGPRLL